MQKWFHLYLAIFQHFPLYMSYYRGALATDVSPCGAEEDDITGILNVFCKHLAHDKSGKSVLKEIYYFSTSLCV